MRVELRIVAGSLKGRKLVFTIGADLRPAPQMVREALFSILGNAVPDRPFFDLFAGTGAVGLEALSRGASRVVLVERDFRVANEIERHLKSFGVAERAGVVRSDAYRWAEHWPGTAGPINMFIGPPYVDFGRRLPDLVQMVGDLQQKVGPGSVITLQAERPFSAGKLPGSDQWELRCYGRNELLIWEKEIPEHEITRE